MSGTEKKEQILFSPIGDTDPIRKMHDGACLHILRRYRPARVVLFLTDEMKKKEEEQGYYTKPIRRLLPEIAIDYIKTDIRDAHLYDSFLRTLPREVYALHEAYPDAEILMNLSSGTPQIKTVMAILSIQEDWCRGVQVASPAHASNRQLPDDQGDIEAMMENNLDDEEGSENRCEEPELRVLRYYEDKNRIESLIQQYEYHAAYTLSKANRDIPSDVIRLLEHASLRLRLKPSKAKKVLPQYKNVKLCPFKGNQGTNLDYFLSMQIDQKLGQLSTMLLKANPLLQELLKEYIAGNTEITLGSFCQKHPQQGVSIRRNLLMQYHPALLTYLDGHYQGRFKDSPIAPKLLMNICRYADEADLVRDKATHRDIMQEFTIMRAAMDARNKTAHGIMDVEETQFRQMVGMSSKELLDHFFTMMCLIYGEELVPHREFYTRVNSWIGDALEKT